MRVTFLSKWIDQDPGFRRLNASISGVLTLLFTLAFGVWVLQAEPVTLMFAGLVSTFSFMRFAGLTRSARIGYATMNCVMLLGASLVGFILPKMLWVEIPVIVCAAFIAFYALNWGSRFAFYPPLAVVLLLLGCFMEVPHSDVSAPHVLVCLSVSGFLFHVILQFGFLRHQDTWVRRHRLRRWVMMLELFLSGLQADEPEQVDRQYGYLVQTVNAWELVCADLEIPSDHDFRAYLADSLRILTLLKSSYFQVYRQFALDFQLLHVMEGYLKALKQQCADIRHPKQVGAHDTCLPDRPALDMMDALEREIPADRLVPLYQFGFSVLRMGQLIEELRRCADSSR